MINQAGARPLVQRTTGLAWSTGVQSGNGARNEWVVVHYAKNVISGCSLAKAAREVPPGLLPRIILTAPLSHASRARGDGQARRVFVPVARRADELKIRPNIGAFLAARLTGEQGSISESRTSSGQRSALILVQWAALVILTVDKHTAEAGIAHLGKGYFLRSAGEGGHRPLKRQPLARAIDHPRVVTCPNFHRRLR